MMHLCSGSQLSSPRSSTMKEHRTRLHACSIERIGDVGGAELFACGTYELDESSSSRHGEIVLFNGTGTIGTTVCESGVLDMKVVNDMVCVALSAGSLALYRVVYCGCDTSIDAVALHIETVTDDPDEGLFLSLDIDNRLLDSCWKETTNIAVSTQQGSVIVFEYLPAHDDVCASLRTAVRICNAHSMLGENMPAWIVLFDPHSKRKLISGGDDMVMKLWDLPDHSGSADVRYDSTDCLQIETPTSVNRKAHTAGVTSGQWHPHIADIFATGSYDEHVRVWDMRNVSKPLLVLHTGMQFIFLCVLRNGRVTTIVVSLIGSYVCRWRRVESEVVCYQRFLYALPGAGMHARWL